MTQAHLYTRNNIALRPLWTHQQRTLDAVRQAIREGHKRIIIQSPTGSGKTLMAAYMIAGAIEKRKRPLFTCPAITLVQQTLDRFEAEGIHDIGVMQANHPRTDPERQVQIASVQTLVRRYEPPIDFVICDEIHLGFKGLQAKLDSGGWSDMIVIGLSATPWRKGMGRHWTKLIVASTIDELIHDRHLSPFVAYRPPHTLDRRSLKIERGEFTEASSSDAMRKSVIVGDVVKEWKEKSTGEKTFLFCVNRKHAQAQMGAFIDAGFPWGYIDANTPLDERKREFARMKYGEIAGIASVGCLIAGVDEDVRTISDCQPTRSEMRHVQKLGRGLRTASGKDHLVLLDHAGNTADLGLPNEILHDHLDMRGPHEKGEAYEDERKPRPPKVCDNCHALVPAGRSVCPQCGARMKVGREPQQRDGTLVKVEPGARKENREDKQQFYSAALGLAFERGFQDGWAAWLYKARFGVWPRGLNKNLIDPTRQVLNFDRERRKEWRNANSNHPDTPQ